MSVTHHDARPEGTFLSEVVYHAQTDQEHSNNPTEQDPLLPSSSSCEGAGRPSDNRLLWFMGPALLAGIFVKAFDIAFLATSYSRLASDLQHFKDASWVMLTASICSAIFVPVYSYLLAYLGIRRMMFIAYGAFALGLGFCAISTSFWQLLGSRFVVGFGSSGITLLSMIVINEIVGVKQLAIWESFVTCIEMGTSMAAGPLGAWMYRSIGWHSVFFLEVVFTLTGVGVLQWSFKTVARHPQYSQSILLKQGDPSQLPSRADVEGWLLLILAVTTPLIAFTLGDNLLRWTDPLEVALLILGPIFMVAFVVYEFKIAPYPVIDMTPICSIKYLRVLFQVFGVISILNSIVFIIPPYIQVRAFDHPSFEDWALTCVFLGFPFGAIIGGYLIKNTILPVQHIMFANAMVLGACCSLFAMRIIKPELAQHAPLLVAFGICTGMWQSCLLFATLSSTEKKWWPQTLALYYLIETFGADLGMALMSTITRSVTKSEIRSSLGNSKTTEGIILDAMKDLKSIRRLSASTRTAVLVAFESGMHTAFFLPCSLAAMVIILAAAMNLTSNTWTRILKHATTRQQNEQIERENG
ncbi:major facilitator superfamily domain-containing protein [Cercophora samala]|uniref:Major facilitator superfamily domain-containing protein n=1 Tax=Cercophora samala TaxID=330535 RepID=A0AA39YWX9_9PEZI|nr:major facilitator superfamily domain-containing protein [Cercophora samala]